MRARIRTLEDIAWRGLRLRVWCYACARARELDGGEMLQLFVKRDWSIDLAAARERFRCDLCGSKAEVLAVPASAPRAAPAPPEIEYDPGYGAAQLVAAFFHTNRALQKRKRQELRSQTLPVITAPPPVHTRTPPRRGHLRLVKPPER